MYNLSRFGIVIFCVWFSSHAIAARLSAPATKGVTNPSLMAQTTPVVPKPVITGFGTTACVKSGALITILGNNFGSLKGASLVSGYTNLPLKITVWQNVKITAYLPSSGLTAGTRYPVGIINPTTRTWLSNIDKIIVICSAKTTGPTLTKTAVPTNSGAKIAVQPQPTVSLHPDPNQERYTPENDTDSAYEQDVYYTDESVIEESGYTTQAVLPGGSGLLMNRQLPAKPPKLSIIDSTDASGNAIAEPGELLVISSSMDEARQLAQQLGDYGLSPKKRKVLKNLGLVITTYRVPADVDLQQTAVNIRQAYPQMWADVNHRYTLQGGSRTTQTAKNLINWKQGNLQCGKGLRIGLIDTAINTEHPALKTQSITSHTVLTNGIIKAKKTHGTAIATLLIGNSASETFSGMLPSANLFSASVFRQRDKHNVDTTAEWIVSGIDWLLSQNVQVINMSVGGPRNLLVDVAIQRTIQSGVVVVAAAGNGGATAVAVYPAAQPGVIAVTAVDNDLELYSEANEGKYIDFSAPGVDIWTGNDKGAGKFVSGTSFAVPFVTAAMADLLKEESPKKAYQLLQKKSKDLGNKGKDKQFGWGLIQKPKACL